MVEAEDLAIDYLATLRQIAGSLSALQRDILSAFAAAPENELSGGQLARLLGLDHH